MIDENEIDDIDDQGKNLWSSLLQEVKEKNAKDRSNPTTLLFLGDQKSGKSSLLGRLQKSDVKDGVALEFDYIEVKDESIDQNKLLNIWIASTDTYQNNLLRFALSEKNFGVTMVVLYLSYSAPWDLIQSAKDWLNIIKSHSERLKIDPQEMQFYKDSIVQQFREYTEPELPTETDANAPITAPKRRDPGFNFLHPQIVDDPDKVLLPLEDGMFDENIGLPIMIVVTKTDYMHTLEQEFEYNDDKFDFIQMHLRKLCLKYGAGLCFTSLKEDKNCNLLKNYLLHRCYGFPFYESAFILEKDSIFIPAGWDNLNKVRILAENIPEELRNQSYENIISKPLALIRASTQNRLAEPEVAEDEQVFLMKQQALIQKAKLEDTGKSDLSRGPHLSKGSSMATGPPGRAKKGMSNQASMAMGVGAGVPGQPGQGNEGVLHNFFNSLLHKKGAGGIPAGGGGKMGPNGITEEGNQIMEEDKSDCLSSTELPDQQPQNISDNGSKEIKNKDEALIENTDESKSNVDKFEEQHEKVKKFLGTDTRIIKQSEEINRNNEGNKEIKEEQKTLDYTNAKEEHKENEKDLVENKEGNLKNLEVNISEGKQNDEIEKESEHHMDKVKEEQEETKEINENIEQISEVKDITEHEEESKEQNNELKNEPEKTIEDREEPNENSEEQNKVENNPEELDNECKENHEKREADQELEELATEPKENQEKNEAHQEPEELATETKENQEKSEVDQESEELATEPKENQEKSEADQAPEEHDTEPKEDQEKNEPHQEAKEDKENNVIHQEPEELNYDPKKEEERVVENDENIDEQKDNTEHSDEQASGNNEKQNDKENGEQTGELNDEPNKNDENKESSDKEQIEQINSNEEENKNDLEQNNNDKISTDEPPTEVKEEIAQE